MERRQSRGRHPAQHDVLLVRQPHLALAELHGQLGERAQLRRGDVAEHEPDRHVREPGLLLRACRVLRPFVVAELRRGHVRERRATWRQRRLEREHEQHAALGADRLALGAVVGEELIDADLVDRPLEPRLRLVVAVADAMEHAHECIGGFEDLALRHEFLDDDRAAPQRREPATGDQFESAFT